MTATYLKCFTLFVFIENKLNMKVEYASIGQGKNVFSVYDRLVSILTLNLC